MKHLLRDLQVPNSEILNYKNESFCVLEGYAGFADTERRFIQECHSRNMKVLELDEIYDKPEQLMALKYLKPNTIVLGTTGTYREEVDNAVKWFQISPYFPRNIIFTHGENQYVFRELLKEALQKEVRVFQMAPCLFLDDEMEFYELTNDLKNGLL